MRPPAQTDWVAVLLLYACGLAAAMHLGLVPPLMADLIADLGLSVTQATWAASLVNLMGVPLSLVAGEIGMRLGLRRALVGGMVLMAIGAGLAALAATPMQFLGARALTGLGYLAVVVVAPALMVLACKPDHRPLATGLWGTFVPVGIALGALLAGHAGDWRIGLGLGAAPGLLLGGLALLRVRVQTHHQSTGRVSGRAGWGATLFSMGFGCYSAAILSTLSLLPLFLHQMAGWNAAATGNATGLVALASAPGALLAGWLLARGWRFNSVALAPLFLCGLCGLAVYTMVLGPLGGVLLAGMGQMMAGLMSGAAFSMVPQVAGSPSRLVRVNALIAQFGNLGSLIGPPIASWGLGLAGWPGVGWTVLFFCILAIPLLVVGSRTGARAVSSAV